jgi:segregation and condensation protein B
MFATTKMFLDYFNLESLDQLPTLEEIQEIADANHALELEDKKEEGDFDLSISVEEMGDSENLQSAAADLEAADALVQQVEDNLFAKAEEEEQADKAAADLQTNRSAEVQDAEQAVAKSDDAVFAVSDSLRASLEGSTETVSSEVLDSPTEEMTEEQLAEATIARMIAEQESLLKQAGKGSGDFKSAVSTDNETVQDKPAETIEDATLNNDVISDLADGFASLKSDTKSKTEGFDTDVLQPDAPSVFGAAPVSANEDDEEALAAALEEEMMAELEAEQEALLEEQESQVSVNQPQQNEHSSE